MIPNMPPQGPVVVPPHPMQPQGAIPPRPPMPQGQPPMQGGAPQPQQPPMGGGAPQQPQQQMGPFSEVLALKPQVEIVLGRLSKAIALLRRDVPRGYRIDIEIDSTIAGDAQEERADAVEFLGAVTKFMQSAAMIGAQQPLMAPLLGKMLQFGVRKFRTGRDLESAIDDFCDQAERKAKQIANDPNAKGPSPEMLKVQADIARAQAEIERTKIETASARDNDARDRESRAMDHQARMQQMQLDMEHKREEHSMRLTEIQANKIAKEIAHRQDLQRMNDPTALNAEALKARAAGEKANAEITKTQFETEAARHSHVMGVEKAQAEHEGRMQEMRLNHELRIAEHGAKLSHLHHQRISNRVDHMHKMEHLDNQRALLREKAVAEQKMARMQESQKDPSRL